MCCEYKVIFGHDQNNCCYHSLSITAAREHAQRTSFVLILDEKINKKNYESVSIFQVLN